MPPPDPNERVTYREVHRDEDLLVVEKRSGLVTVPGVGHEHDTLLNGLVANDGDRLVNLGESRGYGLLHRLDRETSGLVLVALSVRAYDAMRAAFENREVEKFYWAMCDKPPREESGVVRLNIEEHVRRTGRYTSVRTARLIRSGPGGKPALTAYRVLESNELATLVEARPVTGRLHQVRVHLRSVGAAILGDDEYGSKVASGAAPRLALHAHRLRFAHPVSGEQMDFGSMFPKDLRTLLRRVGLKRPDLTDEQQAAG
ncbi:MAG: RluA family pseudouridine synthase [Planctomycetota bacterium]